MPKVTKQTTKKNGRATAKKRVTKKNGRTTVKKRVTKKSGGIIDRIAPISTVNTFIKMNLYGRSGSGKTTLACSFPKPLLLIGSEEGTKSVQDVKGVDFVKIESTDELKELIEFLPGKYASGVLDTATYLQDMVLREILGLNQLPAQRSWGMAAREQWGQCTLQTKELLRALLDQGGCNFVICAQEREFNTESESDVIMPYVGSALTPSVTGWLNPACDYIGQCFIREAMEEKVVKVGGKKVKRLVKSGKSEYCLRTGPDPVYTTKFRTPKNHLLPEVIVDPDYNKILKIIEGGSRVNSK